MTQINFKPVYAEGNPNWRIVYFPGGYWELQEFLKLPEGADRRKRQDWRARNSQMSYNGAMMALNGKAIRKRD